MEWDFFVCHASEDKETFVRPLAEALVLKGYSVWYDEFTLTIGDSLRRSIDKGLADSRYGIVVLSSSFFNKEWPQRELDGLVAREIIGGKTILPVWHNVTHEDIVRYSPVLADKVGAQTSKGLDYVINEIKKAGNVSIERIPTELEARELIPKARRIVYPKSDIASLKIAAESLPETWPVGIFIVRYYDGEDWRKGTFDTTHKCTPKISCYLMVKSLGGILYITWGVVNIIIDKEYASIKSKLRVAANGSSRSLEFWRNDKLWHRSDIWNEAFWLTGDNFYTIREAQLKANI